LIGTLTALVVPAGAVFSILWRPVDPDSPPARRITDLIVSAASVVAVAVLVRAAVGALAEPVVADGWPGRPPGNSQGLASRAVMMVLPLRMVASSRTRAASRSGSATGTRPKMIVTVSPLSGPSPADRADGQACGVAV
jgi:hypothetical protein